MAPSGDLDTEPILPAEPIDPEDMIEPTEPPAASDGASFDDLVFGPFSADQFNEEDMMLNILDLIAGLLPLAGTRSVSDSKFMEIAQSFAKYLMNSAKYGSGLEVFLKDANTLEEYSEEQVNFFNQLGFALPEEVLTKFGVDQSYWSSQLIAFEDNIGRVDSKTGLSNGLYRILSKMNEGGYLAGLGVAYPAILHFAKKIGGSQAEEKLKDIMINLGYMKPEATGREKEGPLKSIYRDVTRQQRMNKALDGIGY